jgi:hypothetical protein
MTLLEKTGTGTRKCCRLQRPRSARSCTLYYSQKKGKSCSGWQVANACLSLKSRLLQDPGGNLGAGNGFSEEIEMSGPAEHKHGSRNNGRPIQFVVDRM